MTFEEIFNEDGKYSSNDFVDGFCFEIMNGSLIGCQYKSPNDLLPERDRYGCFKSLFKKEYYKVYRVGQLFKNKYASEDLLAG